ncbi:MAG TPA: 3-dehydroquinate synthase [Chloroflexia bacterium]|nr:3-dehydroquinate synthase [Chloroflexia bacterium]
MKDNIFIIGFSGTGKTSTGKALAQLLSYEYIDTDLQIEADTGRSVPAIFEQDGEAAFREIESATLEKICEGNYQVVATGGGIVLSKQNRTAMTANGYVFCLEARPESIYVRLLLDSSSRQEAAERPLLRGDDQFERITKLKASREPLYAEADWTIHTDFLSPEEVAAEIVRVLPWVQRRGDKQQRGGAGSPATPGAPHAAARPQPFHRGHEFGTLKQETAGSQQAANLPGQHLTVKTSVGSYPILFGEGLLPRLGSLVRELELAQAGRAIFIISDEQVGPVYLNSIQSSLQEAGFRVKFQLVPAGEETKSLVQTSRLYDWLAEERAERKDLIIALGGGVVGDLTGFVAATWLRGLPFIQVPTTLLAMVDSSVGGKTGVNHPTGKNLIGSFYPPVAVVADVTTLASLPERARNSGWAEVVKHAVIPGAGSEQEALARFERLEKSLPALQAGDQETLAAILRESVAVKAGVVEQDERETGLRITLNYGHTYAHALESAGNYHTLLHGEAVAIGMQGAARLAEKMGLCSSDFVQRQKALLEVFGLPTSARSYGLDRATILSSMKLDKKVESGAIRWILPLDIGRLEIRRDVPVELVEQVLEELI